MPRLLQHRLDPASRLARLMFAEYGIAAEIEDIKPWTRDPHLLELNPAATVPILVDEGEPPAVGVLAVIHAIEERYSPSAVAGLFPSQGRDRAEMWRLSEWVLLKLNDEVTRYVIEEKIVKRDRPGATRIRRCCASPRPTSSSTCTISTGCSPPGNGSPARC